MKADGAPGERSTEDNVVIYVVGLILAGVVLVWRGIGAGGLGYLLAWAGITLIVVGLAYGGFGAGIFGKRPDGSMARWTRLLLLPYLLPTWTVWHLRRVLQRGGVGQEIIPRLWLGRRPYLKELPHGIGLVVDLTAEFPAHQALRRQLPYLCIPVLDGFVPDDEVFCGLVRHIASAEQAVYVHCAMGYGRSASVVMAVLIAKGSATDVESAEALIRRARPRVRPTRSQREQVRRLVVANKIGTVSPLVGVSEDKTNITGC